jgi:hypothetical protein
LFFTASHIPATQQAGQPRMANRATPIRA